MKPTQQLYEIALTCIRQVGPITARNLVSYFGGAEGVFRSTKRELLKVPGVGPQIANNILDGEPLSRAEDELKWIEKNKVQSIFYTHEHFPYRLREILNAPLLLYFKGADITILNTSRIIAIVGTRQPSDWGKKMCEKLVEELVKYNVVVVSGLAYGIDITAHKTCNQAGISNVGVLGNGLGKIYPESHRDIATKLCEKGGLLTEFTHDTPPDRENFPMRNRIIAGLVDALLVVESPLSGGSMISANLAFEFSRDVFAVPGRALDAKSAGCNHLIKTEKARLVENVEDIVYFMNWKVGGNARAVQTQLFVELDETERLVVDVVKRHPEIQIDHLAYQSKLNAGVLAKTLLNLEFKGVLRILPGNRYVLS